MASSPVAGFLQQLIASKLGQGGGGQSLQGANPDALGQAVSQQYSELQNIDPGKIVRDLNDIKVRLGVLFPQAVMRVAGAAKGISQAVTGVNAAIKEFEKAQETLQNIPPLGLSAANPQNDQSQPPRLGAM